jgi:hypothetical protein
VSEDLQQARAAIREAVARLQEGDVDGSRSALVRGAELLRVYLNRLETQAAIAHEDLAMTKRLSSALAEMADLIQEDIAPLISTGRVKH